MHRLDELLGAGGPEYAQILSVLGISVNSYAYCPLVFQLTFESFWVPSSCPADWHFS
jgi:hypothetical protein